MAIADIDPQNTEQIRIGETDDLACDFTDKLDTDASDTIGTVDSVAGVDAPGGSIGSLAKNSGTLTVARRSVAANRAAKCRWTGPTTAGSYELTWTITTSASRVIKRKTKVEVVAG